MDPTRALLVALPVGQAGDDLDGALDHPLNFGQGRLYQDLYLGKYRSPSCPHGDGKQAMKALDQSQ